MSVRRALAAQVTIMRILRTIYVAHFQQIDVSAISTLLCEFLHRSVVATCSRMNRRPHMLAGEHIA